MSPALAVLQWQPVLGRFTLQLDMSVHTGLAVANYLITSFSFDGSDTATGAVMLAVLTCQPVQETLLTHFLCNVS